METESNLAKTKYYTASFHNGGRKEDAKDTKGTKKGVKFQANREHNIRDEEYCKNQEHIGFKNKTEQEHIEWAKTHVLIDEKPEDAYERIFGEAIQKYDAKQKRSDRKIGNGKKYYEKIRKSQKKVPVYEFIITLGNKNTLPDNPEKVRELYIAYLNEFKQRNPNFEVIGAYYHDDESRDNGKGGRILGAPHLHVDYIPVSRNRWQNFIDSQNKKQNFVDKLTGKEIEKKTRVNGLDVENSLTEALEGQGFKNIELDPAVIEKKFGIHINEKKYKDPERQAQYEEFLNSRVDENGKTKKTRLLTAQMQWIKKERDCLIRLFEKNGYKIKNPGEHRPHLETDDYIEQQDQNLQDLLLKQYNELSTKIDFLEKEEQELIEKEKELAEKEKILNQKELAQEQKQREQTKKDEYLNSKTIIVETAESQLEEARQINAETEQYRNDIDQIKKDVKAEIEKDYAEKYQQLYDVQEYQKQQTENLEKQKQEQNQKTEELAKREEKISNLEAEKKAIVEKEKEISEREKQIKIDTDINKNKENSLKNREDELNTAIQNFNEQYATADAYYKQQQQIFEENENILIEYRKEYREKSSVINEWDEAFKFIKEAEPDTWLDNEFDKTFKKKQDTQTLIQRIKQGVKGFIAKIKYMYDEKIKNYEKKLNGFDFKDEKGNYKHSFGSSEIQTMFISEANAKTFRQIADDMDAEGVNNYSELHNKKPKYLERHFEYAREKTRENERLR
jgi:hypothetical protein